MSRSGLKIVSDRLLCYLLNDPLKLDFLDIYLTTFFRVRRYKYTKPIKVILFFENVKN